jgi:hypothetical protein
MIYHDIIYDMIWFGANQRLSTVGELEEVLAIPSSVDSQGRPIYGSLILPSSSSDAHLICCQLCWCMYYYAYPDIVLFQIIIVPTHDSGESYRSPRARRGSSFSYPQHEIEPSWAALTKLCDISLA